LIDVSSKASRDVFTVMLRKWMNSRSQVAQRQRHETAHGEDPRTLGRPREAGAGRPGVAILQGLLLAGFVAFQLVSAASLPNLVLLAAAAGGLGLTLMAAAKLARPADGDAVTEPGRASAL
jgi:hypothetical protein